MKSEWKDPKLWISLILIGLFSFAFIHKPDDETMKGALILAFATAYGYWLGSNKGDTQRTDNTTKALDAIKAAQDAPSPGQGAAGAAEAVADAASDKADEISGKAQ